MDFIKQAQEFAASNNTSADGEKPGAPGGSDGGFGGLANTASNMMKSQGAAPAGDGSTVASADGSLPGGRKAPSDQEFMQGGKLLLGAAQGQKVDQSQLAGAASDVIGGMAAKGHLDEGAYGTYINQAEDYLNKYAGQGKTEGQSVAPAKDLSESAPGNP